MATGAAAVLAALALFGALLGMNLRGARGMPGVVLHGWGALLALALLGLSAVALVGLWLGRPLLDTGAARGLHLLAGAFGVMGLLVFGLAYVLLPMFALAPVPDERRQLASGAAAIVAIARSATPRRWDWVSTTAHATSRPSTVKKSCVGIGSVPWWNSTGYIAPDATRDLVVQTGTFGHNDRLHRCP
jgi:hypothetical protein